MNTEAIAITGITGFLGSHLAEHLSENRLVVGIVRSSSDPWRVEEIQNENIVLVNADQPDFEMQLQRNNPSCLIHCAWGGVSAAERDDWNAQVQNVLYTTSLLEICKRSGIKKFIALGSQAEYGSFSGKVDETHKCKPYSAYGAAKLATLKIVESYCSQQSILYYWLRIFPMYGTREAVNWFIPSVIENALMNTGMDLTAGEQRYGYLYVKDFCRGVEKLLEAESGSGVYNLAASTAISLRNVIELIIKKTNTTGQFRFGALPYRRNQVMHMEGDSEKFAATFDFRAASDFESNLDEVISYYRNKISPK